MFSYWEQVGFFKERVKRLYDDQLGTRTLAVLETIAFVLACVDVFGYGPANHFIGYFRMMVVVLVCLLYLPPMVAWLLRVLYVEACVEEEIREYLE